MAAAVATTKRTLDKEFRGHIDVSAFKAWWPTCEYASEECANTWMRELNLAALRAKQMVDEVTKAQQEKEAAEAAAEAAHVAERQEQSRLATQPKRGLALLTRLRKAEALLQEAHTRTLRDAVRMEILAPTLALSLALALALSLSLSLSLTLTLTLSLTLTLTLTRCASSRRCRSSRQTSSWLGLGLGVTLTLTLTLTLNPNSNPNQEFSPDFIEQLSDAHLFSSPMLTSRQNGPWREVVRHKSRVLELIGELDAARLAEWRAREEGARRLVALQA